MPHASPIVHTLEMSPLGRRIVTLQSGASDCVSRPPGHDEAVTAPAPELSARKMYATDGQAPHTPATQLSLPQSKSARQENPTLQGLQSPPQSTSDSKPSFMPSLHDVS